MAVVAGIGWEAVVVVGIDQAAGILVRTATVDRPDSPNLFVLH